MDRSLTTPIVSVLILVGDAACPLGELHRAVSEQVVKFNEPYEIMYLVQTRTPARLDEMRAVQSADPEHVRVVRVSQSISGEASALAAGFEAAQGGVLFTLPAEYEVDFDALGALRDALNAGADLAIASRSQWRDGAGARMQSRLFNRLVSWASASAFSDIASRTRAFRRDVIREIPIYGEFHRYLPMLADRLGFRVREIPAMRHPQAHAPALLRPTIYLWRALDLLSILFLSRFTRYPLRLFGGVGAIFSAAGALVLAVAGAQRLFGGVALADRPILVLGTLLIGLGVQLFTIGLLGELLLFFHARSIRDYRVAAVFESNPPPLAKPTR
jgi:hypothetical protein